MSEAVCRTSEISPAQRTALIVTAYAGMFVFGAILLVMGSLLPSLQLSYTRTGNLGTFPLAGILGATILVGPFLDTFGAKPALGIALTLISVALAAMPFMHSYWGLAIAALAYGFGGGVLNTATNALVSELTVSGRGAALNLLGCSFSLGALSAPLMMSSLGGSIAPRFALLVLAAVTASILIAVLFLRFPPPVQAHHRIRSLLPVLSLPLVWLFGMVLFFESGSENCMFVWSSKLTADVLRVSPQRANLALVGLTAALGAGRLLAVLWLRWLGGRNTILLSATTAAAGAFLVYCQMGFASMVAGFVVVGLGMAAIFPTTLGLAGDRFPEETGTVFGAIMTVALVGGTAGPALGAWLAKSGPLRVLLLPITAAAMIALLGSIVARQVSKAPRNALAQSAT